jgi:DNA-binding transcriptional ArsR family regulator
VTEPASNDDVARFVRALANETRLRIVGVLSLGARTHAELAEAVGVRPDLERDHGVYRKI